MKKEMLINVLQPEECRIAILEDAVLEELYVERTGHESYVGNIYKGRVVNIEPSIQAAFVDFGVGRNGSLRVSDVEPAYYRHLEPRRPDNGSRRGPGGRDRHRTPSRPVEEGLEEPPPAPEDLEAPEAAGEPGPPREPERREGRGGPSGRRRPQGRSRRGGRRAEPAREAVEGEEHPRPE